MSTNNRLNSKDNFEIESKIFKAEKAGENEVFFKQEWRNWNSSTNTPMLDVGQIFHYKMKDDRPVVAKGIWEVASFETGGDDKYSWNIFKIVKTDMVSEDEYLPKKSKFLTQKDEINELESLRKSDFIVGSFCIDPQGMYYQFKGVEAIDWYKNMLAISIKRPLTTGKDVDTKKAWELVGLQARRDIKKRYKLKIDVSGLNHSGAFIYSQKIEVTEGYYTKRPVTHVVEMVANVTSKIKASEIVAKELERIFRHATLPVASKSIISKKGVKLRLVETEKIGEDGELIIKANHKI